MSERLICRRVVESMTSLSRSSIYERMRAGTFPRARRAPGETAVWWLESEVQEWIAARVAGSIVAGKVVGIQATDNKKAA